MSRDIHWNHWKTFLAVVETGSLLAAARQLSLTQPTVGRHIDTLEEILGAPLFTRSQLGLSPTGLAQSLAPLANSMAATAGALNRAAVNASETLGGVVRITASEIVGVELLPSALAAFRATHPSIEIELHLSNLQQDMVHRDADIAVRMIRPQQDRLIARKLRDVHLGLYAHKAYVDRKGVPETLNALADHDLIGVDADGHRLADFEIAGKNLAVTDFSLRCDSDLGQLGCLRAGLGIGVCHQSIAARDSMLCPVLEDSVRFTLPMWLAMHEDMKADRCIRALYDHLAGVL